MNSNFLTFSASVVFATGTVLPVSAGEIRFWEMPKGCSWTTEYSDGNIWVSTYKGKRSGRYIVTTKNSSAGNEQINTTEYNERGLMTRRVWSGNKWESFEPHTCFGVTGNCSNTYRNADGVIAKTTSKTTRIDSTTYRVRAKSEQSASYATDTVKTTYFGLTRSSRNANFSSKLVELRNCNVPVS